MSATMPRELIKWIQTLDLPFPIKQAKRDLTNGYLFGEIVARYWQNVELHSLENKLSKVQKEANWKIMRRIFARNGFRVSEEHILAVIDCSDGAAQAMLEQLYTFLTKRQIQHAMPLQDNEVPVPSYTRPTQHQQSVMSPLAASPSSTQAQDEERMARENADQEQARRAAQERAANARRAANRPKPKPAMKSATIRAAVEDEEEHAPPVQFSSVTVKALPPQLLSKFGAGGMGGTGGDGTSRSGTANDGGSARGARGDQHENIITVLSRQIDRVLDETKNAPFPVTGNAATSAEYFAEHVSMVEPSLKKIIWSTLTAGVETVATWLLGRPLDVVHLLEFHRHAITNGNLTHSSSAATAAEIAASDIQKDYANHLKHLAAVISIVAERNVMIAMTILRNYVLPHLHEPCLLKPVHSPYFHTAAFIIRHFLPYSGSSNVGTGTAQCLGAVHDFVCSTKFGNVDEVNLLMGGGSATGSFGGISSNGNSGRGFIVFVSLLDKIVQITATADKSNSNGGKTNRAVGAIRDAGGNRSNDVSNDDVSTGPKKNSLSEALASVAYYNTVSGLYSESAAARAASIQLLATLTNSGRGRMLFDNHLDILSKQFATVELAGCPGPSIDSFIARLNLLLAAIAEAPGVFATIQADIIADAAKNANSNDNELGGSNGEDGGISVTEPSRNYSPPDAALGEAEAQATQVLSDLNRYLENVITAAASTQFPLSTTVRLQVFRAVGPTLKLLLQEPDAAQLVSKCSGIMVAYLLANPAAQNALITPNAAHFAFSSPLFGKLPAMAAQRVWPTLKTVQHLVEDHKQNAPMVNASALKASASTGSLNAGGGNDTAVSAAEVFTSPGNASKVLLNAANEAIKNNMVSPEELLGGSSTSPTAEGGGPSPTATVAHTFTLIQWMHTFCVVPNPNNSSGSSASATQPVVQFTSPNAATGSAGGYDVDSPARASDQGQSPGPDDSAAIQEELHNEELTHWWTVMKYCLPYFEGTSYVCEVLGSQAHSQQASRASSAKKDGAGGSQGTNDALVGATRQALATFEAFQRRATACVVRFYLDVSGVQHAVPLNASDIKVEDGQEPNLDDTLLADPALVTKARDWFRSVVASS